jgi:hypothetical protein
MRSMRIALWIIEATYTHLEYVILIALPRQSWLHERASMLRYTYTSCLVCMLSHLASTHGTPTSGTADVSRRWTVTLRSQFAGNYSANTDREGWAVRILVLSSELLRFDMWSGEGYLKNPPPPPLQSIIPCTWISVWYLRIRQNNHRWSFLFSSLCRP